MTVRPNSPNTSSTSTTSLHAKQIAQGFESQPLLNPYDHHKYYFQGGNYVDTAAASSAASIAFDTPLDTPLQSGHHYHDHHQHHHPTLLDDVTDLLRLGLPIFISSISWVGKKTTDTALLGHVGPKAFDGIGSFRLVDDLHARIAQWPCLDYIGRQCRRWWQSQTGRCVPSSLWFDFDVLQYGRHCVLERNGIRLVMAGQ